MRTEALRRRLLAWAGKQKRNLPWRGTTDPYRVWVSEVMLQQTTVGAAAARFERFLERFPTLAALARAREESVLAAWSGLGYYARARNLRACARVVLRERGGELPRRAAELESLPGVGRYTAAAVACLAHGERVAAVEANVSRVLSRIFAIGARAGASLHRVRVDRAARAWIAAGPPRALTAGLMDLGQLVCTPRRPRCGSCPLAEGCAARRLGNPEGYPRRRSKPPAAPVFVASAVVRRDGRALLVRRGAGLLGGLWEFPSAEGPSPGKARRCLEQKLRPLGLALERSSIGAATHTVVNRRLTIAVFAALPCSQFTTHNSHLPELRWFRPRELRRAAVPTLTRKVARAAGWLA